MKPSADHITFDRPAIDKILRDAGAKFVRESVDYDALAEELTKAFKQHQTRQDLEREPTDRQLRSKFKKIGTPAKRLHEELAHYEWNRVRHLLFEEMERQLRLLSATSEPLPWSLNELQQQIDILEKSAAKLLEREHLALFWDQPGEIKANYWLMGALSNIYTCWVGRKPFGISRSEKVGGIPGGPGMRFVQGVLATAGLRVCPETSGWVAKFSEHQAD